MLGIRGRLAPALACLVLLIACQRQESAPHRPVAPQASPASSATPPPPEQEAPTAVSSTQRPFDVDLRRDETRGGHTIARHVGRTDDQLRARLRAESISAASTYPDLATAERVVEAALAANERRVQRWIDQRGPRSNLAIHYRPRGDVPTGRLLRRGARESSDVTGAVVVLRWRDDGWYVLTSYPEEPR